MHQGVIAGKYALESLLGRGAMGEVYIARHLLTAEKVALKLIRCAPEDQLAVARFRREVSIAAKVGHEGIVRVQDAGQEADGTLYLVMELLQGLNLKERANQPGFNTAYGLRVIRAVLEPLAAAHHMGVVHRDIKPENIFLHTTEEGLEIVKLLDFGIARDMTTNQSMTAKDVGLGTPYFMSPEQATNAGEVTTTADVWSMGVILYWLQCGRLPFFEDSPFNTLRAVCGSPHAPLPHSSKPELQRLSELTDKCLAKNPLDRPTNASELIQSLDEIIPPVAGASGSWGYFHLRQGATTQGSGPITIPSSHSAEVAFVEAPPQKKSRAIASALLLAFAVSGAYLYLRSNQDSSEKLSGATQETVQAEVPIVPPAQPILEEKVDAGVNSEDAGQIVRKVGKRKTVVKRRVTRTIKRRALVSKKARSQQAPPKEEKVSLDSSQAKNPPPATKPEMVKTPVAVDAGPAPKLVTKSPDSGLVKNKPASVVLKKKAPPKVIKKPDAGFKAVSKPKKEESENPFVSF